MNLSVKYDMKKVVTIIIDILTKNIYEYIYVNF